MRRIIAGIFVGAGALLLIYRNEIALGANLLSGMLGFFVGEKNGGGCTNWEGYQRVDWSEGLPELRRRKLKLTNKEKKNGTDQRSVANVETGNSYTTRLKRWLKELLKTLSRSLS